MEADLALAAEERKKLFADPLNYKPVTTAISPSDKPVQVKVTTPEIQNTVTTETVTKSNPKTGTIEKIEVKKTNKATISENGLTSRKKVMTETFIETNKFPSNVEDRDKMLKKYPNFTNKGGTIEIFLKHRPFEITFIRGRAYQTDDIDEPTGEVSYKKGDPNWTVKALLLSADVPAKVGLIPRELYSNFKEISTITIKYTYLEKLDPNYKLTKVG